MRKINSGSEVLTGAAAGLLATVLVKCVQVYSQKKTPHLAPPIKQDPGEYMVKKMESRLPARGVAAIPRAAEKIAAQALGFGYGMTFGAAYAACPAEKRIWREGAVLGVLTWAVGYLGWLPATHLMPPVWKQKPRQVFPSLGSHILFGIATAACSDLFRRLSWR